MMKTNPMIWPTLSYQHAKDTYQTLLLWFQIVGKIKLSKLPWVNHSWHVTFFVTPTGLTTGDIPDSSCHFQIDFNFIDGLLIIKTDSGKSKEIKLDAMPIANFYQQLKEGLSDLKIEMKINTLPTEIINPIPFDKDNRLNKYVSGYALDFHKALIASNEVLTLFRSKFIGKCSPVHFFWGANDLAVSRFSGRKAPKHPGGVPYLSNAVVQEAYSHEVYSCGFWPGNEAFPSAAYYAYIYPEPAGFKEAKIHPSGSYYHPELKEYILPYELVQQSKNPSEFLLEFLNSTYEAAAILANWDREVLENGYGI